MIIAKKHDYNGKIVLAMCDANLLGKKIEEKELSVEVNKRFYGGEIITKEGLRKILSDCYIINLVGNESLELCKELGLVDGKHILKIKGISHAQILITKE